MHDFWYIKGWIILVLFGVIHLNFSFVCSLNDEGIALLKFRERVVNDPFEALTSWNVKNGETCPCSWFGIRCADGHVISLDLENLCLEGTLSPDLRHLLHIKSIILRNNSFSGTIPKEFGVLTELKLLNLGYNNLIRPPPLEHIYNVPFLLLDGNGQSCHISQELEQPTILPNKRLNGETKEVKHFRMLIDAPAKPDAPSPPVNDAGSIGSPSFKQAPPPPMLQAQKVPSPENSPPREPPPNVLSLGPPPSNKVPNTPSSSPSSNKTVFIAIGAVGGFIALGLVVFAVGLLFWRGKKKITTGNSPRGLTAQLQRAFVSGYDKSDGLHGDKPSFVEGVKNLSRFELENACEDFSNVIGTCSIGTIYKGTLSNGVEIAVISLAASSARDWSRTLETQFMKKIETLSKVNHKNFINLIGYCEEQEPFTRMMIFEYAPNGSLFEHLHVREAEHLDWGMRLRVAMGMAYCLEHMHQLTPPITHPNLNSASVHLSDDYACKISDFCFWNEVAALQVQPIDLANLIPSSSSPESNVYNYGLVLLEMITGRIPHAAVGNENVDDWISEFLSDEKPLQELVDPMLRRFKPEQLEKLGELIMNCLDFDPQMRPSMKDVCARMKEITGIDRDKAGPRLSPLWWAELEGHGSVN